MLGTQMDRTKFQALANEPGKDVKNEADLNVLSRELLKLTGYVAAERGYPMYLRSDNGPEFVSTVLLDWAARHGVTNMLIEPGKPWHVLISRYRTNY